MTRILEVHHFFSLSTSSCLIFSSWEDKSLYSISRAPENASALVYEQALSQKPWHMAKHGACTITRSPPLNSKNWIYCRAPRGAYVWLKSAFCQSACAIWYVYTCILCFGFAHVKSFTRLLHDVVGLLVWRPWLDWHLLCPHVHPPPDMNIGYMMKLFFLYYFEKPLFFFLINLLLHLF